MSVVPENLCAALGSGQHRDQHYAVSPRSCMHVICRRGWQIPERHATPEHVFFSRRRFLATAALSFAPRQRSLSAWAICQT
jgi:hypothetical protein